MRFAGLGVQLAASLLVLVWLGQWVDRRFGTGGIATIAGAALAFAGTMATMIRALRDKDGDQ
ncbi:MAG TPA: AtpZ/AtpI family protein [Gemmatimonadales bacterium]|nr:AtpZ/AtpI family protein [Gemmatimonadales bacterium]